MANQPRQFAPGGANCHSELIEARQVVRKAPTVGIPDDMMTVLLDCTDVVEFAKRGRSFTGVQRVIIELKAALSVVPEIRFLPIFIDWRQREIKLLESTIAFENVRPHGLPAGMVNRVLRHIREYAKPLIARSLKVDPAISQQLAGGECWIVIPGAKHSAFDFDLFNSAVKACGLNAKIAAIIYDLRAIEPEVMDSARVREKFADWFSLVAERADLLLPVSDSTHRSIRSTLPAMADEKIRRIKLGATPLVADESYRPPMTGRYIAYVSAVRKYKNHQTAVLAWHSAFAGEIEHAPYLVFVGYARHKLKKPLYDLLADPRARKKLVFLENLSDGQMAAVVKGALFFIFPSSYEGWGLPVAEALLMGKFGIVSASTSLPEAGGEFVDYCDHDDVAGWSKAMSHYASNPALLLAKEKSIHIGYSGTSWAESARSLLDALACG